MTEPGEAEPPAEDHAAGHVAEPADDAGVGYGVAQARALLRAFREDTGRDAETVGELAEWMIRRNAGAVDPPGPRDPAPG